MKVRPEVDFQWSSLYVCTWFWSVIFPLILQFLSAITLTFPHSVTQTLIHPPQYFVFPCCFEVHSLIQHIFVLALVDEPSRVAIDHIAAQRPMPPTRFNGVLCQARGLAMCADPVHSESHGVVDAED